MNIPRFTSPRRSTRKVTVDNTERRRSDNALSFAAGKSFH